MFSRGVRSRFLRAAFIPAANSHRDGWMNTHFPVLIFIETPILSKALTAELDSLISP